MTPPSCLASVAPSTATPSTTDVSSIGSFDFNHHSHRRFNPLTNSWVLCSPHRTQRPWQGKEEDAEDSSTTSPSFDSKCYLCPGNTRANKTIHRNPDYKDTFVFENDFPAVQQDQPELVVDDDSFNPLLQVESVRGQCHVICFSPNHDKTLADMSEQEILPVIDAWIHVYDSLKDKPDINHVQIFENKGAIMGCSNPHPHGQAWSTQDIPQETAQELENMHRYKEKYHRCMLCDYVMTETKTKDTSSFPAGSMNGKANAVMNGSTHLTNGTSSIPPKSSSTSTAPDGSRIVCENASFLCVVPFWATWPFETMVLAKTHVATLSELNQAQKLDLATILRQLTCRYDNLFKCSFPYSMGIHQAPTDGNREHHETSHLHLHFYPPLLRSATVKKFLVGFELLGQAQRDLTPEQAAKRLTECSYVHYKKSRVNT
ncbi:galactose-1-phosphate uridyl transferase [Podila minutissima]|uniref:Galactose-1-phosphate uridylyltransferase n=1 Tax=Podila minutissima TaxID=64525 RepID=A0A9P5SLJ1_9FUNG|nr:galactose-1-phosphate uridyl transferase [Podila minutissima]